MTWPDWWEWELAFTEYTLRRMRDRSVSETDIRLMLEDARGLQPDHIPGRWAIQCRHDNHPWLVILEPDDALRIVVVVTAYPAQPL